MMAEDALQMAQERMNAQIAMDTARMDGVMQARQRHQSLKNLSQIKTHASRQGMLILGVITLLVFMFMYSQVFANNKRVFWILTAVLGVAVLFKFAHMVREDGGLTLGLY